MVSIKEFILPYKGLNNGVHTYKFDINHSFFKHFEMSRIQEAELELDVTLDKQDNLSTVLLYCEGTFKSICDRCLAQVDLPLDFEDRIYINYGGVVDDDESVIYLDWDESELDLTNIVYELIHVNLPISNIPDCESEDFQQCDKITLNKMAQLSTDKPEGSSETNDLWLELKKIKFKK